MRSTISVLLLMCAAAAASAQQTILIDFGSPDRRSRDEWNNVAEPREIGVVLPQAMDSQGDLTSVRLSQLDAFSGFNVAGFDGEDAPFAFNAASDSYYLGDGDNRSARLKIDGLSVGESYSLTLYASRMGGDLPRRGRYRIGERSVELDAHDNKAEQATLADVQPSLDGSLTLDIECVNERGYAYLGVLKIEGEFRRAEPIIEPADGLDGPPLVTAKAWVIADGRTGELLWGDGEETPRQIASVTKVMTAHLIFDLISRDPKLLEETVTISQRADNTSGSSAEIGVGERIPVSELLYGLLLPSGNDAATALAEHFNDQFPAGDSSIEDDSMGRFVAAMNARAQQLGMSDTRYFDPHGNSANRSTAASLARLAFRALQDERFRKYVSTAKHRAEIMTPDGGKRITIWRNTNRLLGIEGFDGIKTGTTSGAGSCLLSSGRRGDSHLLVVVLGSTSNEGRYVDTRNLFRWAWRKTLPPGDAASGN